MLKAFLHWRVRIRNRRYTKHLSANLFKRIAGFLVILLALIGINTLAMIAFEGMDFSNALWLSMTTLTTVGYGDFSPTTAEGRIVTVVSMYLIAIALLGQIVGEYIDWRAVKLEKLRLGTWEFKKLENHIQIINTPNLDTELYLNRLLRQVRDTPKLRDLPVQLLTRKYPEGIPASLKKFKLLHRTGEAENTENLLSVGVKRAAYIVILARDFSDATSDSLTFDILSRIEEMGTNATIIVEAVSDSNRARLSAAGADAIIRPIRAYPEIVVRSMTDPGTEQVMENIFSHQGGHLARIDVQFSGKKWADLQCTIIQKNYGTPVAYVSEDGQIVIPSSNDIACDGIGIISLVSDNQVVDGSVYQSAFTH